MADPRFYLLAGASSGLLLLAAKVHGRHLRLERELAGFPTVTFGRDASNPAWVEALWRRDRWRFWTTTAVLSIVGGSAMWFGSSGLEPEATTNAWILVATVLWAPTIGFLSNGAQSWVRFRRDARGVRVAWTGRAERVSQVYWAAMAGGAVVVGTLALA